MLQLWTLSTVTDAKAMKIAAELEFQGETSTTSRRQTLPELNASPYALLDESGPSKVAPSDNRRKNSMPEQAPIVGSERVSLTVLMMIVGVQMQTN
jgi:hypothetical protein